MSIRFSQHVFFPLTVLQRKFNIPVVITVMRAGLITVTQQDQQLAKFLIGDPRPSLQDFAVGLIRECLSSAIANRSQFNVTIDVLGKWHGMGKANEKYVDL